MRLNRFIPLIILFFIVICLVPGFILVRVTSLYGPPSRSLSIFSRVQYSVRLLSEGNQLTSPLNPGGAEQPFHIDQGESISSIATRLQESFLIADAQAFYDYVVYTGLDQTTQAGDYSLSPAFSVIDLVHKLQDATPKDVTLVIIPGWRMEEVAASLPTSGLDISPDAFIAAAQTPPQSLSFVPASASMEGFFFPDTYIVPRITTANELLDVIGRNFALHITNDLRAGFAAHGLDVYQAVTLASLVERESVHNEEMTLIASVFINRLNVGMNLGSDATVQYALGYNSTQGTWWTNPLSLDDLKFDSPYNTYIYAGLPPGPIASPSLEALQAVAFPQTSDYYFFQARCDNSGYHNFAVTFEEQLANVCP